MQYTVPKAWMIQIGLSVCESAVFGTMHIFGLLSIWKVQQVNSHKYNHKNILLHVYFHYQDLEKKHASSKNISFIFYIKDSARRSINYHYVQVRDNSIQPLYYLLCLYFITLKQNQWSNFLEALQIVFPIIFKYNILGKCDKEVQFGWLFINYLYYLAC